MPGQFWHLKPLSRTRFDALAGYTRDPRIVLLLEEIEWHASPDERVIGMVVRDRTDHDFGWVILGRDERLRYRAIACNVSRPTLDAARAEFFLQMAEQHDLPDEAHHQGDAPGRPMDFLTLVVPEERLNPRFKLLTDAQRYSPARGIIEAMMRYYKDADGNFVEQFQTSAFDARMWELYLFATFTELGYAPADDTAVPDFVFSGPLGTIAVEATSAWLRQPLR